MYGDSVELPKVEDVTGNVLSPYALTKLVNEEQAKVFSRTYGIDVIGLRYFNVLGADKNLNYGPIGLKINSFSNNLFKSIIFKKEFKIFGNNHKTYDGPPVRDFIHVDDLTNAFIKLIRSKLRNKIYNLGSGKETSINKIASLIGGKKIFIPEIPGETQRSCANISMICKDINWKPKIAISDGIKRLFKN